VRTLVGDDATVEVIMPPAASPHDFAPSAQQVAAMREADVLVVNGGGFEAGLVDAIEAAEADGATVVTATDAIRDGDADPHVFADPVLMQAVVAQLGEALPAAVAALDTPAFTERVEAYRGQLEQLHQDVARQVDGLPAERRVLVTNHDVLGRFADRYGFEVLGVVIPGGATLAEPSAADLTELADLIEAAGVPAIFVDSSSPARLAEALADEGADVEVVELYTESLSAADGPASTYLELMRTNAERIVAALGG